MTHSMAQVNMLTDEGESQRTEQLLTLPEEQVKDLARRYGIVIGNRKVATLVARIVEKEIEFAQEQMREETLATNKEMYQETPGVQTTNEVPRIPTHITPQRPGRIITHNVPQVPVQTAGAIEQLLARMITFQESCHREQQELRHEQQELRQQVQHHQRQEAQPSAPTRRDVIAIQPLSEGTEIEQWLQIFEATAERNGWPETEWGPRVGPINWLCLGKLFIANPRGAR
ncbi:uncharacterized protein TRIADDRAFT_62670 [Trichoplax adhaerens]|uniref:Uncharacterized protein n=1 Tax=Trichoplax adhaerens TaxID=10228 RepID=B3SEH9_TRIAD|nr:predicted protein [Trichoplax adhaerens]EDV18866.1 predicted protein [Trichoplax adhaerens]|eukprot:XP_002118648.1 predicted protein [Trichoplax adhaerens]